MVYMASCGGSSCTGFNANNANWFKIDQSGLLSGTLSTGQWGMGQLVANNNSWTSTIPSSLAAGAYLIRWVCITHPAVYPLTPPVVMNFWLSIPATNLNSTPSEYPQTLRSRNHQCRNFLAIDAGSLSSRVEAANPARLRSNSPAGESVPSAPYTLKIPLNSSNLLLDIPLPTPASISTSMLRRPPRRRLIRSRAQLSSSRPHISPVPVVRMGRSLSMLSSLAIP